LKPAPENQAGQTAARMPDVRPPGRYYVARLVAELGQPALLRSPQFGQVSAPMMPQPVQTMRGRIGSSHRRLAGSGQPLP
jgi:hypothetical protein